MKRTAVFSAALLAVLPLLTCGCAPAPSTVQPVTPASPCPLSNSAPLAVAVGARANVPKPKLPPEVQDLMRAAAKNHQRLTLIRVDGQPRIVFDQAPPPTAGNPEAEKQAVTSYLAAAQSAFGKQITAVSPQADVLTALSVGARTTQPGGTVVLVDSGLQTVAPLDFAKDGLLQANPAEVAKYLTEGRLLPDLHGRTVLLVGLGNTAPPQPVLDNNLRAKVVDTWKAVAEASGACVVTIAQGNTDKSVGDKPEVAVVAPPPAPAPQLCGTVELGERDNISFNADTDTFRDPQAARETLRKFAEVLRDGRHRAELIGTTATDGPMAGRVELSMRRAEAVKAVLVEFQVAADHLTARGVGTDWPGHLADVGPDGRLLPGPAGQNRKVIMNITCSA
ncbi:OmpA family protein [Kutzneria albida]|uniref:OmpA-like domain-containing protein n=1 Tax=Kutzneria albida DSM 43870 TaxID=1449976 RepID=W5W9V8_9PSEU|nr:OmpA family protein [Kutzneria albida]AHH97321.1 hypothetical protein KALB_3957 [Kutzneria albida DSM 43870]